MPPLQREPQSPQFNPDYKEDANSRPSRSGEHQRRPFEDLELSSSIDNDDLEDSNAPRSQRRSQREKWWNRMIPRTRRTTNLNTLGYREDTERLLAGEDGLNEGPTPERRKRNWYNYCIFGGISGLTILAILLAVNLLLTLATLLWSPEPDDGALQNWGRPGTGTELLAWYPTDFTRNVNPIPCHSHNDYWRRVPLFSALRTGCISVEADVWQFTSEPHELYVGHRTASLTKERTFQSLYIQPLVKILEHANPSTDFFNGTDNGVFDVDPSQTLTLLIDVKTAGEETWLEVLRQLQPLRERGWLSYVENDILHPGPITVVGTGNTPFDILTSNTTYRDAFFDAPLETMWESRNMKTWPDHNDNNNNSPQDEEETPSSSEEEPTKNSGQGSSGTTPASQFNTSNSFYASVQFSKSIGRMWHGRLNGKQIGIIRGQIRGAHKRGLKVRYWDLPSWPLGLRNHVWDVLVREGVDVLNVDDLRGVGKVVW